MSNASHPLPPPRASPRVPAPADIGRPCSPRDRLGRGTAARPPACRPRSCRGPVGQSAHSPAAFSPTASAWLASAASRCRRATALPPPSPTNKPGEAPRCCSLLRLGTQCQSDHGKNVSLGSLGISLKTHVRRIGTLDSKKRIYRDPSVEPVWIRRHPRGPTPYSSAASYPRQLAALLSVAVVAIAVLVTTLVRCVHHCQPRHVRDTPTAQARLLAISDAIGVLAGRRDAPRQPDPARLPLRDYHSGEAWPGEAGRGGTKLPARRPGGRSARRVAGSECHSCRPSARHPVPPSGRRQGGAGRGSPSQGGRGDSAGR